jgi:hypothetical protein
MVTRYLPEHVCASAPQIGILFLFMFLIALDKHTKAILGAHGYKVHETYSPPWTQVDVPKSFLELVCPMAEKNIELVKGKLTSVIMLQTGS